MDVPEAEPLSMGPPSPQTLLVIQNDTPTPLKLHKSHYWAGCGDASDIKANSTAQFRHRVTGSSIGALVYTSKHCNREGRWVIAWSNQPRRSNKAYTKILERCDPIDFNEIRAELEQSSNRSSDNNCCMSASLTIDQYGDSPTLIAM